jgi:hypothetical protein
VKDAQSFSTDRTQIDFVSVPTVLTGLPSAVPVWAVPVWAVTVAAGFGEIVTVSVRSAATVADESASVVAEFLWAQTALSESVAVASALAR